MQSYTVIRKSCWLLAIASSLSYGHAAESLQARVEVLTPFSPTFRDEELYLFVRVTNTGNKPVSIRMGPESEFYFENDPVAAGKVAEQVPRFQFEFPSDKRKGFILPPGRALVLSDLDICDDDLLRCPALFMRVRVHFLLERGRWIASDWLERKILPDPDLSGAPLFEYGLQPGGSPREYVLPLAVGGETWLFTNTRGVGTVGTRLCRLPEGIKPLRFENDAGIRRLAIHFSDNEDPVVINTRTGMPLSGSERTVPHLHYWKNISGRPFSDRYQEMLDRERGLTTTGDEMCTTVPAIPEPGGSSRSREFRTHPLDPSPRRESLPPGRQAEAELGRKRSKDWLIGGVSAACMIVVVIYFLRRRA